MLHIKKGDEVVVLSGEDKGKRGKVLAIFPKTGKAIVEGVNIVSRHQKPRKAQEQGGIKKMEAPIYICKLQVIDPATKEPTRVGFAFDENGNKVRIAKKSGKAIDGAIKEDKKKATSKAATKKAATGTKKADKSPAAQPETEVTESRAK